MKTQSLTVAAVDVCAGVAVGCAASAGAGLVRVAPEGAAGGAAAVLQVDPRSTGQALGGRPVAGQASAIAGLARALGALEETAGTKAEVSVGQGTTSRRIAAGSSQPWRIATAISGHIFINWV